MRRTLRGLRPLAALGAAALVACAGAGALSPGARGPKAGGGQSFPSPEELEKLGQSKLPQAVFGLDVRRVSEWRLAGPFPERIETVAYSDGTPWAALLDEAARRRAGLAVPTEAMYCVARELGRFFLATGGGPTESLRRFILTRCHAPVARVGFSYVGGPVPPGRGEAEILAAWRASLEKSIEESLTGGPRAIGIWFGREPAPEDGGREGTERAVVMVVSGAREVHVEPIATVPDESDRLVVRGEALGSVEEVSALANRGEYGVQECEDLPGAALPRFAFACALDRGDAAALVSLAVRPRESLLSHVALHVLAWPQGRSADTWREVGYAGSRIAGDLSSIGEDLTELLNQVRARAGLRQVVLDPGQSRVAAELAAPFFASVLERAPHAWAELAVLGILAGWSVDGTVQAGYFTSSWLAQDPDLGHLLSEALEEPSGRQALLAADVERIAVGGLREGEGETTSIAAVFGTYELFSEADHARSVRAVVDALTRERARHGLGPPKILGELAGACDDAAIRVARGAEPRDAMDLLLRESVEGLGRSTAGWVAEVSELRDLDFPDEYVRQRDLELAVAVSHRKEQGEAWGRYVVMLVIVAPESRSA
jgi:hypothetical protein